MAIVTLICEQCGGKVKVDDTHEFGVCEYCKSNVLIKSDIIQNVQNIEKLEKHVYGVEGKDVDELIADGNKLLKLGDEENANAKFKQAIDVAPKSWEAWLGYATTGGDNSTPLSCVPAYRNTYNLAADELQQIETFSDMVGYLPDRGIADAFIRAYKDSPHQKRHEVFKLVLGVIGCDDSEIASLALDLRPNDWRVWLAKAKIRQIRVRWCEMEVGFFKKQLPEHVVEVMELFLRAHQLAKSEGAEATGAVLSHISTMERDESYKVFYRELSSRIS